MDPVPQLGRLQDAEPSNPETLRSRPLHDSGLTRQKRALLHKTNMPETHKLARF